MVKVRIFNHGMADRPLDYGPVLEAFLERFPKCVVFAGPTIVTQIRHASENVGIPVHRFDSRTPPNGRLTELGRFAAANRGIILTTPKAGMTGWRTNADAILLIGCDISLLPGRLDQMLSRADVKEVHLVDCNFLDKETDLPFLLRVREVEEPAVSALHSMAR